MFRTFIPTADLAAHLDDPSWVVVDVRYSLTDGAAGLAQYREGHIPGAVYASLSHDLSSAPTGANGRHPLPSVEAMAATFGRLGIGPRTQVVCYDADNMFAARLWWMLRYLGHDAVAVLDGGFPAWTAEGRPVRAGDEHRAPATFTPAVREGMRVGVETVAAASRDGGLRLIDARAPERFEGRNETLDKAAGHIPGAGNHFFKQNFTADGTVRPADELRGLLAATAQGRPMTDVVMYCGSGVTACQNLLAAEHVGLPGARLYVGSWSEWSADPDRPVETGPAT
ncbi:MAG: sulfurtransferase [Vicinamibacterales bacterium]